MSQPVSWESIMTAAELWLPRRCGKKEFQPSFIHCLRTPTPMKFLFRTKMARAGRAFTRSVFWKGFKLSNQRSAQKFHPSPIPALWPSVFAPTPWIHLLWDGSGNGTFAKAIFMDRFLSPSRRLENGRTVQPADVEERND